MKKLLLLLAILIVIPLAPVLLGQKGYIVISIDDMAWEMTVAGALLFLSAMIFIGMLVLWPIRLALKFSSKTWRKMAFTSSRKAKKLYQQGVSAYLLGDYQRAEQLLADGAEGSDMANSAWLMAAQSALELDDRGKLQNYLQLVNEHPAAQHGFSFETLLFAAQLQLKTGHIDKARALLDGNHKLISHDARLMALNVEVHLAQQQYPQCMEQLKSLRKQKNFSNEALYDLEYRVYSGFYKQLAVTQSVDAVNKHFKGLSRKEKHSEGLILAYADCLASNGMHNDLEGLLLPLINKKSSPSFIKAMQKLPLTHAQHIIDSIQALLQKDEHNTMWLSALAHLCFADKQYSKAHKAFVSLLKIKQDKNDLQTYAKLLTVMEEHQQANRVYQELLSEH
ncbi:heme biosynthesis HemY N-terminal domain-containing protein [Thalassotalea maritima]|uniref:heme biosynthesis HemY N-terminal domain-containing protein n=1 Tax=Thalassotalea maritima TaxID=3242416 RepID=UPI003528C7C0